jgi:hypothetical protein
MKKTSKDVVCYTTGRESGIRYVLGCMLTLTPQGKVTAKVAPPAGWLDRELERGAVYLSRLPNVGDVLTGQELSRALTWRE